MNLLRLKKEIGYARVKDIRNFFRLKNENETTKNKIIIDIRNLSEHEEKILS